MTPVAVCGQTGDPAPLRVPRVPPDVVLLVRAGAAAPLHHLQGHRHVHAVCPSGRGRQPLGALQATQERVAVREQVRGGTGGFALLVDVRPPGVAQVGIRASELLEESR